MNWSHIATAVIKEQEKIVGPLAIQLATHVQGLVVAGGAFEVKSDAKQVLHDLVGVYSKLFGGTSIEVCKETIKSTAPDIPDSDFQAIFS